MANDQSFADVRWQRAVLAVRRQQRARRCFDDLLRERLQFAGQFDEQRLCILVSRHLLRALSFRDALSAAAFGQPNRRRRKKGSMPNNSQP